MNTDETEIYFNKVYNDTYKSALKYILSKCGDIDATHDILQDVYTDVYRSIILKGISHIKEPTSFTIHIAKAKLSKYYKSKKKQVKIISILEHEENEDIYQGNMLLSFYDIEEKLLSKIAIEEITVLLKSKSKEIQNIFFMHYYCDMTIKSISEKLIIKESTIKSKLYRTLEEIRSFYKEEMQL